MTYFNFIDLTTQVRIEYGNGVTVIQYFLYPKNTLAVSVLGNVLTVSEAESAQLVVQVDYSTDTVIAPTSTDINDLATQLANIFSGTGSGGGDATAANQMLEIGLLTGIQTQQTNGNQKTQVVGDTGTSLVVETDGSINVNTTITGVATEATLQDVATTLSNIEGNQTSGAQATQVADSGGNFLAINGDGSLNVNTNLSTSAIGRLKVSDTTAMFDAKHLKDKLPLLFDEVILGGATSVWNTNGVIMNVSTNGDAVIRKSFRNFNYTSGRPIGFDFTMEELVPEVGTIKRFGAFTSTTVSPYNSGFDGVFVESDSTTTALKVYTGGLLRDSVDITTWINGGDQINLVGGTIFNIEFLWLGYWGITLSASINGVFTPIVELRYDGNESTPFFNSPNKPIRYEIRSTGGTGEFIQVCSAVYSEGVSDFIGTEYSINSGSTLPLLNSSGVRYILCGLRLKSTHLDITTTIDRLVGISTSNDDVLLEVIYNPTVISGTAPTFTSIDTNVALEAYIPTGTLSSNILTANFSPQNRVESQYLRAKSYTSIQIDGKRKLGSKIDGTSDIVYICATPLSTGLTAGFNLTINEK